MFFCLGKKKKLLTYNILFSYIELKKSTYIKEISLWGFLKLSVTISQLLLKKSHISMLVSILEETQENSFLIIGGILDPSNTIKINM